MDSTRGKAGTGYWVKHCGHPTALWPYYGETPDGQVILAPNGRGFQYLKEAQAAVIEAARAG